MDLQESERLEKLWQYEKQAYQRFSRVAGVDEAGRGPLAGPVVASACFMPFGMKLEGLNDSKKLSPNKRKAIYNCLLQHPDVHFAVEMVEASEIDRINIYQATKLAMERCISRLSPSPDFVLVDGMELPHPLCPTKKLIKGDSLSCSIAAASIIAKETRDQWMLQAHEKWPQYAFDKHKGYGTKIHLEALKKWGPCPIHRHSFSPVKEWSKELLCEV